jgi:hypothetical protein
MPYAFTKVTHGNEKPKKFQKNSCHMVVILEKQQAALD